MTIYTPSAADKKPEKETLVEPEVVTEPLTGIKDVDAEVANASNELRVRYLRVKWRCYIVFLLLISSLLLSVGIFVTYRHFSCKKGDQEVYRGKCGTQFYDELYHGVDVDDVEEDYVEEELTVSPQMAYDEFHLPYFDEVRESYVLHDYALNYTAIVDHEWQRCYITGIRKNILRPSGFVIQIRDASGSTLVMKTTVIREDYMMVIPPGLSASPFGRRIAEKCESYEIFWLELFVNGVVKRSVDLPVATYAELTHNPKQPVMYKMRIHDAKHSE